MNTSKKQKGFVLVVLALLLVALIGFLALAVDIGVLYSARTSAQEVADAAALAGAFTFINDTQSPQPQTASSNALQVALNNSVLGQPVAAADVNVNVDVANRRVAVDVQSTQNTYFAELWEYKPQTWGWKLLPKRREIRRAQLREAMVFALPPRNPPLRCCWTSTA